MSASLRRARIRSLLAVSAVTAIAALAATSDAAAFGPPSAGSSQVCVGVQGGWEIQIVGVLTNFPADATGTVTFTFANGEVVTREAVTNDEGIAHTDPFYLDVRDPQLAALVGTNVYETATLGGASNDLTFLIYGCPTAPDRREACRDEGYTRYPSLGFTNQGDCVSWVATNGKNEPGKNVP